MGLRSHHWFWKQFDSLAPYFDLDPVLFRIGWAIFALMGGMGVLAYVAAYIIIPEEGTDKDSGERAASRPDRQPQNLSKILGVVLVVMGSYPFCTTAVALIEAVA